MEVGTHADLDRVHAVGLRYPGLVPKFEWATLSEPLSSVTSTVPVTVTASSLVLVGQT